jgi:hypothetical protein
VSDRPNLALPRSALDVLMATLNVDVIGLIECLVSPGWRLSFGSVDTPAIRYNLSGTGRMVVGGFLRISSGTSHPCHHTGQKPFHIEVDDRTAAKTVNVVGAQYSHAVFAVVPNLLRYPVGRMFVFPLMCWPPFSGLGSPRAHIDTL